VSQARRFAKAFGARLPGSSTEAFPRRVRETTPMDLFPDLEMLLATIEELTKAIRTMEGEIEVLCRDRYPETDLLSTGARGWSDHGAVLRAVRALGSHTGRGSCTRHQFLRARTRPCVAS
jgi:hypothetical protein